MEHGELYVILSGTSNSGHLYSVENWDIRGLLDEQNMLPLLVFNDAVDDHCNNRVMVIIFYFRVIDAYWCTGTEYWKPDIPIAHNDITCNVNYLFIQHCQMQNRCAGHQHDVCMQCESKWQLSLSDSKK